MIPFDKNIMVNVIRYVSRFFQSSLLIISKKEAGKKKLVEVLLVKFIESEGAVKMTDIKSIK